jgi:hypothetical protein
MYSCSGGALPKKFTLARELVANAHAPMLVTLLGIVTLVNSLSRNANAPMFVTPVGIVTFVICVL